MKNFFLVLCLCFGFQFSFGQTFKTHSISIFKNGLAFIQKKASLKTKGQQAILYDLGTTSDSSMTLRDELGALKFGSLWFESPRNELHSVSRYISTVKSSTPVQNLRELLQNNKGKAATFIFRDVHAPSDPKIRKDPFKVIADTWTLEGDFLMLSAGGKWSNALMRDVEGVEFASKPRLTKPLDEEQMGLHLQFNSSKSTQEVDMMYVRNGIYWVPNYHMDLLPGGKAKLRLVANLLNDVEDIEDCSINFVAGVPNFEFQDVTTPLGSDATVPEFMQELTRVKMAKGTPVSQQLDLSTAAFSNSISYNYSPPDNTTTVQRFIVTPESDLQDGMFLYTKDHVSLRKGGRALISLFEKTVPVEKVYNAELPRSSKRVLNRESTRIDVVQSFKVQNTSGRPWTHGPVFVTDSQGDFIRPIANDNVLFTPAGMHAYVKAADANDILLYDHEAESTGSSQALVGWRKLTMNGGFSLTNMREESVVVEISRIIEGIPKQTSGDWEVDVLQKKLRKNNQLTKVTWRIELKAQQTKAIDYKYTVHNYQ